MRLIILISILLFNSCKKSTEPLTNGPDTTSHEFSWQFDTLSYPGSDQTLIDDLWGSSENDVYAVGHNDRSAGQIWHWDGIEWKSLVNDSGPIDPYYLRGGSFNQVFGTSKDDIWVVGGNYTGSYPNLIRSEIILHYDGTEWVKKEFGGIMVLSVWGISSEDVWFGTIDGELIHFNGADWVEYEIGFKAQINSIAGLSSDEVYAHAIELDKKAPDDSTTFYFLKYDGQNWNIVDQYLYTLGQTEEKFGGYLWSDQNTQRLYASGDRVYLWGGEEWIIISDEGKGMISGSGENNIFTVSMWHGVFHYNGSTWVKLHQLPKLSSPSVWANKDHVFISSYLYDGVQKSLIIRGTQK